MDKQKIIDYVLDTPTNTNPRILGQMLDQLSGGGGGGGDLSAANATFSSTTFQTDLKAVTIDEDDLMEYRGLPFGGRVGDKTYNILLYKGLQKVLIPEGKTATVTGNATVDQLHINITGDCTITIS